jgi:hypothetical protein
LAIWMRCTVTSARARTNVIGSIRPGLIGSFEVLSQTGQAGNPGAMVELADVRALALTLPRTTEHLVRDRVKFRVGRIVYLGFTRDETLMGFAFPKEEREALVAAEPDKFLLPAKADLRYNWVAVRLAALDADEMEQRVCEAWSMVVPAFLVRERLGW